MQSSNTSQSVGGRWLAGLLLLALGAAGCGAGNGLTLGRVAGTVTYRGEPVRQGTVTFLPDESKGTNGPGAMGVIGNDGAFLMTTEQSGDGAVVGFHKVGVLALGTTPVSGSAEAGGSDEVKDFFSRKAKRAAKSAGPQSKKAEAPTYRDPSGKVFPILIPEKLTRPAESGIQVKVERGTNKVNITIQENGIALIEK